LKRSRASQSEARRDSKRRCVSVPGEDASRAVSSESMWVKSAWEMATCRSRDAREERAVRASEDLRGEAVDTDDAQELQLLQLALHG
jgi:hypothetical protein